MTKQVGDVTPDSMSEKVSKTADEQFECAELGNSIEGTLVIPANVFNAAEERKVYRKVRIYSLLASESQRRFLAGRLPDHARSHSSFRSTSPADAISLQILALLYLLSFMDRGNIGNARLANLEVDL